MKSWIKDIPVEELIAWRHHFHQHPELSFKEYETANHSMLSHIPLLFIQNHLVLFLQQHHMLWWKIQILWDIVLCSFLEILFLAHPPQRRADSSRNRRTRLVPAVGKARAGAQARRRGEHSGRGQTLARRGQGQLVFPSCRGCSGRRGFQRMAGTSI